MFVLKRNFPRKLINYKRGITENTDLIKLSHDKLKL